MDTGEVIVPLTDPAGIFYTVRRGRAQLSADPRSLADKGAEIDPRAIFSVLQFGAVIPPLTPWKGVNRLVPGHRYRVGASGPPTLVGPLPVVAEEPPHGTTDCLADSVTAALDMEIAGTEPAVVLFSGGVDSGLIAARLAAAGRRDALLINYSFGDDDSESRLAEAMAARLGLPFARIPESRDPSIGCLDRPGEVYPLPFADHSTSPTSMLAQAVVERFGERGRVVFDGTGADGAFGMASRIRDWERLGALPRSVPHAAAAIYRWGVWIRIGRAERVLRVLRRSAQMPPLVALLAQNPLAGILYDDRCGDEVYGLLAEWVGGLPRLDGPKMAVAGDLALICASIFAQKARPILLRGGLDVRYPFLSPSLVSLGVGTVAYQRTAEPKAALKRALSRSVPSSMVFRPKSGFVDPSSSLFSCQAFIGHLVETVGRGAPLESYLSRRRVRLLAERLSTGARLPAQTLNCAWAIVFLDRWLRTVPTGGGQPCFGGRGARVKRDPHGRYFMNGASARRRVGRRRPRRAGYSARTPVRRASSASAGGIRRQRNQDPWDTNHSATTPRRSEGSRDLCPSGPLLGLSSRPHRHTAGPPRKRTLGRVESASATDSATVPTEPPTGRNIAFYSGPKPPEPCNLTAPMPPRSPRCRKETALGGPTTRCPATGRTPSLPSGIRPPGSTKSTAG